MHLATFILQVGAVAEILMPSYHCSLLKQSLVFVNNGVVLLV